MPARNPVTIVANIIDYRHTRNLLTLAISEKYFARFQLINTTQKVFIFRVFLVRIFPYLDLIEKFTEKISVFSPNAGKYEPENLRQERLFLKFNKLK